MSKLTERLREVGVLNALDFAKGEPCVVKAHLGRWPVMAVYGGPDRVGSHYEARNGLGGRWLALSLCKEYVEREFKIREWKRTPYGSWMDARFVERRMAELKRQLKEAGK